MIDYFRKLFVGFIPKNNISCRKLYDRNIYFFSSQHLNLFFYKKYEPGLWLKVKEFVKLNPVDDILDIGANIGQSMIAFNWCFPKNSITSFEPQKKEYSFLEFNRLCNTIPGRSINSLVVSEPGNYNLFIDNLTGGRSTCIDMTNTLSKDKVTYDSEISLLSDFISEKTKLIKVDIEGYEKELFKTYHSFYDHIYFIIEVRSSSSKHILSTFLKTHKVYFVERNAFLEKVDEIISETLF